MSRAKGVVSLGRIGEDNFLMVKVDKLPGVTKDTQEFTIKIAARLPGGDPGPEICCDGACCNGLKPFQFEE